VLRDVVDEIRAAGRTVLFSTHQMEQAEKVCDVVCIIARGVKVLDGNLLDIKRAASEGQVAIGFADDASRTKAEPQLADTSLVAKRGKPQHGDVADCEVRLADGVTPQKLLNSLVSADVGLRLFEVVVPTLHQIFVARVGEAAAVAERRENA
jgi:ABC-2 type transport system ATP-binding protein